MIHLNGSCVKYTVLKLNVYDLRTRTVCQGPYILLRDMFTFQDRVLYPLETKRKFTIPSSKSDLLGR